MGQKIRLKHWKRLKVNNVKHGDEHGVEKKEDQRVIANLATARMSDNEVGCQLRSSGQSR